MSALSLMAAGRQQVAAHRRGRRRGDQRPPHPRQRVGRGPGHRRPAPPGRRGDPHRAEAVHVSGHARQGELRTLFAVATPEWFIPVHGEYRHMVHHARLALPMGIDQAKALLCEDGDVIHSTPKGIAPRRPGARRLPLRGRDRGRRRARGAPRPPGAGRGRRGHGRGHRRPPEGHAELPARDHDPGLDPRARGRGAARRGQRGGASGGDQGPGATGPTTSRC